MTGKIEVIAGPMFSGKSDEICRRARRYEIAGKKVVAFHHSNETRFSRAEIVSRSGYSIPSTPTDSLSSSKVAQATADVIIIDEAQFFDDSIVEFLWAWRERGKIIIVSGLDMNSEGKPFGPMPGLLAIADEVLKLKAVCINCGADAPISYCLVEKEDEILVGDIGEYTALCWQCYFRRKDSPYV